ncbi:MAG: hypothetical protein ACYSVY_15745 [Planctomycetota bacterium]|jgi:hypothetical protein
MRLPGYRQWRDVPVSLSVNVHWDFAIGTLWDDDSDRPVSHVLPVEGAMADEMVIDFRSSGYYDPGQMYGPPENCYPPEEDDERIVEAVTMHWENGAMIQLSREAVDNIGELFEDQIRDVELDEE